MGGAIIHQNDGGPVNGQGASPVIRTPDQRLRVFVSSTLHELAPERSAARAAISTLRLAPVMFELGARPHPPRDLYRAYLEQSHVFVGIYWQRYGWVAPGEVISGLEDEYRLSGDRPKLIYVKGPAPEREERLSDLLTAIQSDGQASYKHFSSPEDLEAILVDDLALLLSERFETVLHEHVAPMADPPLRSVGARIPIPPTPLVGRAPELRRLTSMVVDDESRLVTLVGPGGVGKTRLAMAAAHEVDDRFADGVLWVDLASVGEAHEALGEIALAVGAGGEDIDEIMAALAARQVLIVLDTVEHVSALAQTIGKLLASVPGLSFLATGRNAVRISAERVFPVAPLPLPSEDGSDLEEVEAGRLLVERARAAQPWLVIDEEAAAALAAICIALDGLPLALELAAARMRLLSPRAIADRLAREGGLLGLLTGGARDLPDRQRTLAATIAWSHRLMDDETAAILENAAVFAGPFDIEAVEEMAPGTEDVIESLTMLVEGSLLRSDDRGRGPELWMPRPVREYVLSLMAESGRLEPARRRHARIVLEMARRSDPSGRRDADARLDFLEARVDDIRAALRWSISSAETSMALDLCAAVFRFWQRRGRLTEGRAFLDEALGMPGDAPDDVRGRALFAASVIAGQQGDLTEGRRFAAESVDLLRDGDDEGATADALNSLGTLVQELGDYEGAVALLEEALAIRRRRDDQWGILVSTLNLGNTHYLLGADDEAERHWGEALEVAEAQADSYVRAMIVMNMGALRKRTVGNDEARRLFELSLELRETISDVWGMSTTLANLGELEAEEGNFDEARAHLRRGLEIQGELADRKGTIAMLEAVARLALASSDHAEAARLYAASKALRETHSIPQLGPEEEVFRTEVERLRAAADDIAGPWSEGEAMSLLQATTYARAYVDTG